MEKLLSFISENREWLFSGLGVAILGIILSILKMRMEIHYPKDRARDIHIFGKDVDTKISIKGTSDISASIQGVVDKKVTIQRKKQKEVKKDLTGVF